VGATAALALALAPLTDAAAAVYCADTAAAIHDALLAAQGDGEDDEVRVVAGTYAAAGIGFGYATAEHHALVLSGGWDPGCGQRDPAATTTFDGGDQVRTLILEVVGTGGIEVEGLTFAHGLVTGTNTGAGLYAQSDGDILIEDDVFVSNQGTNFAAGLYAGGNAGSLTLRNNLFIANRAGSDAAGEVVENGPAVQVSGNTVIANTATNADGDGNGGLYLGGEAHFTVANNLFWNNGAFDVRNQTLAATFLHNDYAHLIGQAPGAESEGDLDVEPDFAPGLLNLHLAPGSPLVNAGADDLPAGLGVFDASGADRLQGRHVDIGAYETDVIFTDGVDRAAQALPSQGADGDRQGNAP
jgi:hypothetical protein